MGIYLNRYLYDDFLIYNSMIYPSFKNIVQMCAFIIKKDIIVDI